MNKSLSPLLSYYWEHLAHVFGEEKADRIVEHAQIYSEPLCDQPGSESDNVAVSENRDEKRNAGDDNTAFESQLEKTVFPLIGLYRAMLLEGFTESEVGAYLKALWDIAPESVKERELPVPD